MGDFNLKVLVLAPHMDDEVVGVGGTIAKHVDAGDEVYVCFVANRVYGHKFDEKKNQFEKDCTLKAKEILGYKQTKFLNLSDERLDICTQDILIPLEKYIQKINPVCVYINHKGDNHQDHKAVFRAAMIALRSYAFPGLKRILCYETPSSTDQSPPFHDMAFLPNYYINIEDHLPRKIEALKCYQSEIREFPHPRSIEGIKTLAKKRGMEIFSTAAEAFVMVRGKWE